MKPTDGFCERQTVSGFIVAVLYSGQLCSDKNNKVYFEQYYADLKKDFDKMSTKRTDNMLNEIKQNNSGD